MEVQGSKIALIVGIITSVSLAATFIYVLAFRVDKKEPAKLANRIVASYGNTEQESEDGWSGNNRHSKEFLAYLDKLFRKLQDAQSQGNLNEINKKAAKCITVGMCRPGVGRLEIVEERIKKMNKEASAPLTRACFTFWEAMITLIFQILNRNLQLCLRIQVGITSTEL